MREKCNHEVFRYSEYESMHHEIKKLLLKGSYTKNEISIQN